MLYGQFPYLALVIFVYNSIKIRLCSTIFFFFYNSTSCVVHISITMTAIYYVFGDPDADISCKSSKQRWTRSFYPLLCRMELFVVSSLALQPLRKLYVSFLSRLIINYHQSDIFLLLSICPIPLLLLKHT